ncbi:hypothetical protein ACIXNL_20140 [Bacteroides fragilis]
MVHCWKGNYSLIKEAIKNGYDIVNAHHEYIYLNYNYKNSFRESISFQSCTRRG